MCANERFSEIPVSYFAVVFIKSELNELKCIITSAMQYRAADRQWIHPRPLDYPALVYIYNDNTT